MTVTLEPDDLILPAGELSNDYFPLGDLDDQLVGWLAIAVEKVEANSAIDTARHDNAAAAYVYYRAYDYIANLLAALPTSQSEGDGAINVVIAQDRPEFWRLKANSKLAAYNGLIVASTGAFFFATVQGQRGR